MSLSPAPHARALRTAPRRRWREQWVQGGQGGGLHRVLVGLQLLRRVVAPVDDPWRLFIERRLRVDQRAHLQCIRDADDAGVGRQKQA